MNRRFHSTAGRVREGAPGRFVHAGVVLALLGLSLLALPDQAAGASWSTTGPLGTPRDSYTATLLQDGRVLIAGGLISGAVLATAEIYDPTAGTFSPTAGSMGTARFNHIAALLPDGKVLVAGGTDSFGNPLSSAELFDPAAGTWENTGSMGTSRFNPSAAALPDGRILVAGGRSADPGLILEPSPMIIIGGPFTLASAELYDPIAGAFSPTGSMEIPREWHMLTLLLNGKVLVSGGSNTDGSGKLSPLSTAELYDPATGLFSSTGSMGSARFNPTATLLESGKVLVAGGIDTDAFGNPIFHSSAELYDPAAETFSATGSMSFTVFNETATRLPDGKVLFAGGHSAFLPPIPTAAAQLYDPGTGTFSLTVPMSDARHNHYATDSRSTLLQNGKVLVAGGIGAGGTSLASAELFDPGTVLPSIPSIASVVPASGPAGTEVTITGSNFGSARGNGTVTFNGTVAGNIAGWSDTLIQVAVPSGATTGPVIVTVSGASSNGAEFTVTVEAGPSGGGGGGGCAVAGTGSDGKGALGTFVVFILLACSIRAAGYFLRGRPR